MVLTVYATLAIMVIVIYVNHVTKVAVNVKDLEQMSVCPVQIFHWFYRKDFALKMDHVIMDTTWMEINVRNASITVLNVKPPSNV
jgi:hypothetical protein